MKPSKRQAALFLASVGLIQIGLAKALPESTNRATYETSRLPVFAPPPVAFPVAWTINALSLTAGLFRVLSLPGDRPGRRDFVRAQAVAWILFSIFNAAYFGLRSPLNAAAITLVYSAMTIASVRAALALNDRAALASLATTSLWLCIAAPLSVVQAAWNRDPFWNLGPFIEPDPRFEKS